MALHGDPRKPGRRRFAQAVNAYEADMRESAASPTISGHTLAPRDRQHAEKSLGEEKAAIAAYTERGKSATSPKLKRALSHAAGEEREHAKAFSRVLGDEKANPLRYLGHFARPDVLAIGHNPGMAGTMHEFKAGTLHSGSKKGPIVKNRAQAIAIGMSQARRGK